MAAKSKIRTLDAICAKLKSVSDDTDITASECTSVAEFNVSERENGNIHLKSQDTENNNTKDGKVEINAEENLPPVKSSPDITSISDISLTPAPTPGSGRRKSRKTATPRNITQVREIQEKYDELDEKDELAEYEINNQNTNFPPEEIDEELSTGTSPVEENMLSFEKEDLESLKEKTMGYVEGNSIRNSSESPITNSINTLLHSKVQKQSRKPRKSVPAQSGFGAPLDLSISRASDQDSINDKDVTDQSMESGGSLNNYAGNESLNKESELHNGSEEHQHSKTTSKPESSETSALEDYAESTMNELLSMYGFSGTGDSMAKISLDNISSKQILQSQAVQKLGKSSSPSIPVLGKQQINGHIGMPVSPPSSAEKKGIYANYVNSTSKSKSQNAEGIKDDKFINSAAYIKAVFNNQNKHPGPQSSVSTAKYPGLPDYSKYLKRFSNGIECKVKYCKELGYREHFHCMDCNFRVFVKKEEMVRHFKWHRKREESLQHGFMRYSPMDDCSQKFGTCTHNGRQTHYHCLQVGCGKVYISTSDVQMHANYHRKDSAIIQEGFQRFRATEDCGTQTCAFYGQRTTHFHCRRPGCNFTFKNKADMEKHKTYHQKDEVLGRDGFKKFMKYEHCGYMGCRYSKVSNHIHCIRSGCNYVLHSTAQLFSHKRKHERRDFETAYRKFREENHDTTSSPSQQFGLNLVRTLDQYSPSPSQMSMSLPVSIKEESMDGDFDDESCDSRLMNSDLSFDDKSNIDAKSVKSESSENMQMDDSCSIADSSSNFDNSSTLVQHAEDLSGEKLNDSLTLPIPSYGDKESTHTEQNEKTTAPLESSIPVTTQQFQPYILNSPPLSTVVPLPARPPLGEKRERDESWKTYLVRYTANDPCNSRCQYLYKDHYHCRVEGCLVLFRSKDGVREHARFHELQDRITPVAYTMYNADQKCPHECQYSHKEKHYHCIWSGCSHVVPHAGPTFGRLEHYRIHEFNRNSAGKTYKHVQKLGDESPRKRGRPPKYPKNDIPVIPKVELSEIEIKKSAESPADKSVINGFKVFEENEPCPDELCIYHMKHHYHCARPRCHQATDRLDVLNLHAKDFHSFVNILEGFEFFDRNINCRRSHCHNNKANRHFHCVRPKCDYSFVRHSTMIQHNKKHDGTDKLQNKIDPSPPLKTELISPAGFVPIAPADCKAVIKTSGTYYPLSGLKNKGITTVGTISSATVQPIMVSAIPAVTMSTMPIVAPSMGAAMIPTASPLIAAAGNIPLTLLLQKGGNPIPAPSWLELKSKMHYAVKQNCGRPFCKLKKKDHYHCFECTHAFSDEMKVKAHISKHGIKVEKIDSEMEAYTTKSGGPVTIAPKPEPPNLISNDVDGDEPTKEVSDVNHSDEDQHSMEEELSASDSLNLNPSTFSSMIAKAQQAHGGQGQEKFHDMDDSYDEGKLIIADLENDSTMSDGTNNDSVIQQATNLTNHFKVVDQKMDLSKHSGRKRTRTKHDDFIDSNSIVVKHRKLSNGSNPSPRSSKDDSVPDGYIRIRHKEDCNYPKCAYRQGVTHFHCARGDCGYSFSDRSRLIQHTLRHERIDSLTGGEMQQYRMNQDCGLSDCEYNGKASHFHCLKCNYNCTDSSKVLTHRKYHAKLENISSQGFHKYSVSEKCGILGCQHEQKQTHYHCIKPGCSYAVLGPAQMASHNIKHANDSI